MWGLYCPLILKGMYMKKIVSGFILLIGCISVFSAPATYPAVYGDYYMEKITSMSRSTAGFDTLVADDSTTLVTKGVFPAGCAVILARDAFTGTGADSVALQVIIDAYDVGNNLLYRTVVDSIVSANSACVGEQMQLPINASVVGDKFTIKLKAYGSTLNGGQVIVNRFYVYQRKLYSLTKPTTF